MTRRTFFAFALSPLLGRSVTVAPRLRIATHFELNIELLRAWFIAHKDELTRVVVRSIQANARS